MKFLAIFVCLSVVAGYSQVKTEFEGNPVSKISEGGFERMVEKVDKKSAPSLRCIISEIDGKYYWASRKNKELVRIQSGAFVTYIATDGSGFIRVILPDLKEAASMMSKTEEKYDYVESMYIGISLLTYFWSRVVY